MIDCSPNNRCLYCSPTNISTLIEEDEYEDGMTFVSSKQIICGRCQEFLSGLKNIAIKKSLSIRHMLADSMKKIPKIRFSNYVNVGYPRPRNEL